MSGGDEMKLRRSPAGFLTRAPLIARGLIDALDEETAIEGWEGEGGSVPLDEGDGDFDCWFLLGGQAEPRPFVVVEPFRVFRMDDPSAGTYANVSDVAQPVTLEDILEAGREVEAAGRCYREEASPVQIEQIRAVVERLRETGSAAADMWLRDRLRFAPPMPTQRHDFVALQSRTMRMPRLQFKGGPWTDPVALGVLPYAVPDDGENTNDDRSVRAIREPLANASRGPRESLASEEGPSR